MNHEKYGLTSEAGSSGLKGLYDPSVAPDGQCGWVISGGSGVSKFIHLS